MISIHRYLRSFCRWILLCWKTWYWTVADFDIVSVEILEEFVYFLKKCFYSSKKNLLPIPAATLQLYGGLNHIILRPLQYRFSFSRFNKYFMLEFDILFITTALSRSSAAIKIFCTVENVLLKWHFIH